MAIQPYRKSQLYRILGGLLLTTHTYSELEFPEAVIVYSSDSGCV